MDIKYSYLQEMTLLKNFISKYFIRFCSDNINEITFISCELKILNKDKFYIKLTLKDNLQLNLKKRYSYYIDIDMNVHMKNTVGFINFNDNIDYFDLARDVMKIVFVYRKYILNGYSIRMLVDNQHKNEKEKNYGTNDNK